LIYLSKFEKKTNNKQEQRTKKKKMRQKKNKQKNKTKKGVVTLDPIPSDLLA